jgi:hypothetical protein
MEHLSSHLSIKNHPKRSKKDIGSVCYYVKLWVRGYLWFVAIVDINLIHRTVDLKYVLSTQVVRVQYEGRTHLFSVSAVSTRTLNARDPESNISESLGALSVNDAARLYIVDWDTTVAIEDNVQVLESKPLSVRDFSAPNLLLYLTTWISLTLGSQINRKALVPT